MLFAVLKLLSCLLGLVDIKQTTEIHKEGLKDMCNHF